MEQTSAQASDQPVVSPSQPTVPGRGMVHTVSVEIPPTTWSASPGVNSFAPWRASTLLSLSTCLFLSFQPSLKLAHRVAVFGSQSGIPGTDSQSIDVAANMLYFRRGQFACIL